METLKIILYVWLHGIPVAFVCLARFTESDAIEVLATAIIWPFAIATFLVRWLIEEIKIIDKIVNYIRRK